MADEITVGGITVPITHPDKVLFPQAGFTKLDLAHYYVAVAEGALRGAGGRPNVGLLGSRHHLLRALRGRVAREPRAHLDAGVNRIIRTD